MNKYRYKNKVVLVVGATGGIGRELCNRLADDGANIIMFSNNEEKLKSASSSYANNVITVLGNANSKEDIDRAVKVGIDTFGKIDVMIHAVGSIFLKPIHNTSLDQFREILELNLISPFLAIKSVIRKMMTQKSGSIVVLSSIAGSKGLLNHEAISAAKGGMESMIRSAAVTYAKRGIRFNGVALGLVDTPLAEFLTKNEMSLKTSREMHPMGRIGSPQDVVEAIMYLASDDSSWVTGTIIPIDGGMRAN